MLESGGPAGTVRDTRWNETGRPSGYATKIHEPSAIHSRNSRRCRIGSKIASDCSSVVRAAPLPKKKPTAYLKDGQLFFDTIVFTPEALRHLIAETGPGQIMIGTDYPFPWTSTEVDLVLSMPGLSDEQRIAILGGTAAKLLGIK